MEKYSKAVREMYSQFKQREVHPLEKYIGRLAGLHGRKVEVVGYHTNMDTPAKLIVDASQCGSGGWTYLVPQDVIFKKCEGYLYVSVSNLID